MLRCYSWLVAAILHSTELYIEMLQFLKPILVIVGNTPIRLKLQFSYCIYVNKHNSCIFKLQIFRFHEDISHMIQKVTQV